MSKRRHVGDWVWLAANSGFVGESDRLKAQIQPESPESPDDPPPCFECEDSECREWTTLWTEPDPKHDGRQHMLCHVSECRMFDDKQHDEPERNQMDKPIIGLVGGVSSGKSVVADMLADCGCGVIDADSLAHQCLDTPDCIKKIQEWWGESVIASHGVPRSKKIAEIVFADPAELKRLEDLLYPLIAARQKVMIADYVADDSILGIVLDAPKLYEAGVDKLCDAVIFVKANQATRISRVVGIRGWTDFQLAQRERMQDSLAMKEERSDYVVKNDSDLGALRSQVEQTFSSILGKMT